ncbi:MAG: VWA domain-containing protein [Betaproteobacteria bacterium]
MGFHWPEALWLLFAAPLLLAAYLLILRRRKRSAVRYSSLGLVREAMAGRAWRRHLPPALLLVGLVGALLAIARPNAVITLPSQQRSIILAIDVSLSMRAADVQPSRLMAAQAAARRFVQEQPPDVRIGIVSFAGTAALVQRPTSNKDDLVAAIDRLQLDRQTAIGSGIVVSLATLFPEEGIDLSAMVLDRRAVKPPAKPAQPASNPHSAIILLTDGRTTTGPRPLDAARMAAERGIRVFTVGFGTAAGAMAPVEGYSIFMMFDEETLKAIADLTGAEYFHATTADELTKVYEKLGTKLVMQTERTEITVLFAIVAALLIAAAAGLSIAWFSRIV